jgi:hypothetical protein
MKQLCGRPVSVARYSEASLTPLGLQGGRNLGRYPPSEKTEIAASGDRGARREAFRWAGLVDRSEPVENAPFLSRAPDILSADVIALGADILEQYVSGRIGYTLRTEWVIAHYWGSVLIYVFLRLKAQA